MSTRLTSPAPTTAAPRKPLRGLAWVITIVLLAHWGVLHGLPLTVASFEGRDGTPPAVIDRPFTTRTIQMEPPVVQASAAPLPVPLPATLPAPTRRLPQSATVEFLQSTAAQSEPNPAPAPAEPPQTTGGTVTEPTPLAAPPSGQDVQLAKSDLVNPTTSQASPAAVPLPDAQTLQSYAFPGSVRLKYDIRGEIKGFPYFVNGELLWLHDGKTYDARLEISHFLLGSRVQTSKGRLGLHGLEPIRFGDKVRSEVAAHFDRNLGKVVFSANTPDAPLLPGAQDQLSVFLQLASMLGGSPKQFRVGTQVPFQAIGPRASESWTFVVGDAEVLTLPGGAVTAIKLARAPVGDYDPRVEVWLAPAMAYLPVRIRLTQGNGDIADQQWASTQKP